MLFMKLLVIMILTIAIVKSQYNTIEKVINPMKPIDLECLDLIKGNNNDSLNISSSRFEKCNVFKCFEERFPCGKTYWIMNWGFKYCVRYSNSEFIKKFTQKGKLLLDHLTECLPKFLEKYYKSTRALNCDRLSTLAFKAQGKCYMEKLELFCVAFPENKDLFIKVLDQNDFLNFDSISMISKVADKCNPKLDLASFIFGG